MILCLIIYLNTRVLAFNFYSLFDHSPQQLGGLIFFLFRVLKIGALISLIVNKQAVPAKQSGPLRARMYVIRFTNCTGGRFLTASTNDLNGMLQAPMRSLFHTGLHLSQKGSSTLWGRETRFHAHIPFTCIHNLWVLLVLNLLCEVNSRPATW